MKTLFACDTLFENERDARAHFIFRNFDAVLVVPLTLVRHSNTVAAGEIKYVPARVV